MPPVPLILDTDIGSDVDDAVTLAMILGSPEFDLQGVTVVTGDVLLRARIAMRLLRLRRRVDIPVMLGAAKPMLEHRPVWLTGEESSLIEERDTSRPAEESAPAFIARTVMANPGQVHIAAVAPLTNIAMAMLLEPEVARAVAHIWIMGGAIRGPDRLDLGLSESNIDYDPIASRIVMASGAPISLVPLDVTRQVPLTVEQFSRVRARGTPFHAALADQFEGFVHVQREGHTHMHDPLTVAGIIAPDLLTWRDARVDVETRSDLALGATLVRAPTPSLAANVRLAVAVEADRFTAFLLDRLER
jgi:purine nucleosidase